MPSQIVSKLHQLCVDLVTLSSENSSVSHEAQCQITMISSPDDIKRRIVELEVEHRDLDAVIDTLVRDALHEELQLRRLKKRKLQLKDQITLLKMQLVPDIPA